jgi:glycolate oxidase iron-sulfur subunit
MFSEISDACIKCGKCIPNCTIHQNNLDEVTSPRGFLDLLGAYSRGELLLDLSAKEIFESCFLCTNCVDSCPNDLQTDFAIENIRKELVDKYGLAPHKQAFFYLLKYRKLMDLVFKAGFFLKTCGFKKVDNASLQPRFNLPFLSKDRIVPNIKKVSFLNKYDERISNQGSKKVAIFIGCLANYNYTEVGDSLIEIFKALNIDIFIPKKQYCCAAPAYFTGDFDTVRHNAMKNIEYFESFIDEVDAIVIPEATCSAMIKHDYEMFFAKEPEILDRVKKLNKKIFISTEYLVKHTDLEKLLESKEKKLDELITYHDPCHSRKVQGIYKEPRALLSKNYNMNEMSDPNRCCGFGGVTIQSEKFHLAKSAGVPKAKMIEKSGAKVVSAECSACHMQLSNALFQNDVDVKFMHPLELIAKALK